MKKMTQLLLVAALGLAFKAPTDKVYVCLSSTSVAYHQTKSCRGLGKCRHEIVYITKKQAVEDYAKRACKVCY